MKRSFASADGEHGLVIVRAAWSPDSGFFVFSGASSGGHQPWHSPIFVYSREANTFYELDKCLSGIAVVDPDFDISSPHLLRVRVAAFSVDRGLAEQSRHDTYNLDRVIQKCGHRNEVMRGELLARRRRLHDERSPLDRRRDSDVGAGPAGAARERPGEGRRLSARAVDGADALSRRPAHFALDNNRTERGLRGVVLGRKNHHGSRSRRGLKVAALFYSLIEPAKLCGVEPKRYLLTATRAALADRAAVTLPHTLLACSDITGRASDILRRLAA